MNNYHSTFRRVSLAVKTTPAEELTGAVTYTAHPLEVKTRLIEEMRSCARGHADCTSSRVFNPFFLLSHRSA